MHIFLPLLPYKPDVGSYVGVALSSLPTRNITCYVWAFLRTCAHRSFVILSNVRFTVYPIDCAPEYRPGKGNKHFQGGPMTAPMRQPIKQAPAAFSSKVVILYISAAPDPLLVGTPCLRSSTPESTSQNKTVKTAYLEDQHQ